MTYLKAALIALVFAVVGGASAQGQGARGSSTQGHALVRVDYADTVQGVSAMFAVRACVSEDEVPQYRARSGEIPSAPPTVARLEEHSAAMPNDIVVRVIDVDGREISRHEGATNVCGYARLVGAFLALDRASTTKADQ